jgi:murein DD-endopeptidase MepM/ murein hydrolase activator NlpD
MSHRSPSRHREADHAARYAETRTHSRAVHAPHPPLMRTADYTLGHSGRQLRFTPVTFWSVVGTLVIMAAWTLATACYFAFHDDLLTRLIARQAQMQYGYEDRIAELRIQVDRLASRQLLDQEQYEQKLDQLIRRETILESHTSALSSIPDLASTGLARPSRTLTSGERAATTTPPKPSPISDVVILVPPPDREAQLESRVLPGLAADAERPPPVTGVATALTQLERALNRVEAKQVAALNGLEESYDAKARQMRGVLTDLGLDLTKGNTKAPSAGVGGPFVPVKLPSESYFFERLIYRINLARNQVDFLNRALFSVPIRKPLPGDVELTSGFGVRLDPFLHSPAMHTGVDFRGEGGEPIHATAGGVITHAGWSGGYGKMVEIDHGNGFSTRYGHLSSIDVQVGESVRSGQVVGRLGSTGRSTGPHLHYETRVDGEAVDPQKFLRAGLRLGGLY